MKDTIIIVLLVVLVGGNGYLFYKVTSLENSVSGMASSVAAFDTKSKYWDQVVEIVEDCMEYSNFSECKNAYPQYRELFR